MSTSSTIPSRLHVATRLHYALLRYLGEGIDIGAMLRKPDYAAEVLHVCRGSQDAELMRLADQFEAAPRLDPALSSMPRPIAKRDAAPQDAAWSQDSSGFGITQPPAELPHRAAKAPRWFEAERWFSRDHHHRSR